MKPILIIVGSAPCMNDDLQKARALIGNRPVNYMVIGLSTARTYDGPVTFAVIGHCGNLPEIRRLLEQKGAKNYKTIDYHANAGIDIIEPDPSPSGSSSLIGTFAAISMGYRKIILAGCPLSGVTSHGDPCDEYHPGWDSKKDELIGIVKSMSGWTKGLLGEPTAKWIEKASPTEGLKTGIKVEARWDYLIALAKRDGWSRGVELGLWYGQTFFHLLEALPSLHLTGVDIWDTKVEKDGVVIYQEKEFRDKATHHLDRQENRREVYQRQAQYAKRSTLLDMFTVDAAKLFSDNSVDFVFIDASHDYTSIVEDITAWTPKVKRGGFLVGHDFEWPTVAAAVIDTLDNYYADDVGPNGEILWAWRKP